MFMLLRVNHKKTELYSITATHPLELTHIDFLTIESGKMGKDVNKPVVTDHFTWYAQGFVTPSQTAWVIGQTLWNKFFMHCGLPEKILSDQGCNFESQLIAELCELSKTKKLWATSIQTTVQWTMQMIQCDSDINDRYFTKWS